MMKRYAFKRAALVLALMLSALPFFSVSALSNDQTEAVLSNGTRTGVYYSQFYLDAAKYGSGRVANLTAFALSNTNLSVEVLNCGKYIASSRTLENAVNEYNSAHPGKQVISAINGDLWMTSVHSGSNVTASVLKATRGVLMIDGEIWASQQIDQENYGATNAEKNTPASEKVAFGVTGSNQPLIGSPELHISLSVNGRTIACDGLNRLPALDSLILYNHRINSSNYALNDAYEIELTPIDGNTAVRAGGSITAAVRAIYPAGSEARPAIAQDSIILTAHGDRIALLQGIAVGDTVTVCTVLTDRMGRTALWQEVTDAIGGHMQPVIDDAAAIVSSDTTAYPTSIVGYRDDGTVVFATVTSEKDKSRAALRICDAYSFCKDIGLNSAFYLDGGGSTTMVSLTEGSYTVRNKCSDGSPRSVTNALAVVWNDTRVCEAQGDLTYIKAKPDLSQIPPTYMDGALLAKLVHSPNALSAVYDETAKALRLTTTERTNDPFIGIDLSQLQPANAEAHGYILLKAKTDLPTNTHTVLYYAAGGDTGPAQSRTVTSVLQAGTEWQYLLFDMTNAPSWTGQINSIRLDIFDSTYTEAGSTVYVALAALCRDMEAVELIRSGGVPEGAVGDYLVHIGAKPAETEPPTTEPTVTEPPATEPETTAPTATEETTKAEHGTTARETTAPLTADSEKSTAPPEADAPQGAAGNDNAKQSDPSLLPYGIAVLAIVGGACGVAICKKRGLL